MIFKNTSLVKRLILCSAFMLCFYGCIDYTSTREEREIKRTIGKTIHLEGDFIFVDSACVNTKLPYISPVKVVTTLDYNDCYECMLKPILGLERIITSIDSSDLVQLIAFVPNADVYRIQEALRRCNIGASVPEEYGDYFAWGATEPFYKTGYAQENPQQHWKKGRELGYTCVNAPYQTVKTTQHILTRWSKYGKDINSVYIDANAIPEEVMKEILDPEDDAAHAIWGGEWRMTSTMGRPT